MPWTREQMAQKAAEQIKDGEVVNLGIGMPTLVANYLKDRPIMIHSENGLLGMGPFPVAGSEDPQVINA
ncbi:MAG: succinyl-CoA--3-ketoacid-CoA transferase, partial [Deltaproteobacteria bacterium]|nr:succinyl-CoA--3-ketoacid-CoA transferase [Deltaproteobacteria bacterium]